VNRYGPTLEFKTADVSRAGDFAGYAAHFGNVDRGGDVIVPGAFAATLAEYKARGTQPALLWAHDASQIIGRINSLREDGKGLFMAASLTLDVTAAKEAHALLKDEAIGGLSIGYGVRPGGDEFTASARMLKNLELYEVSLVAVPMNPEARVTAVKAMTSSPRELEQYLRTTLSLSSRKAKAAASALWPILCARDERNDDRDDRTGPGGELGEAIAEIRQLTHLLKGHL
jgi:HK97 family phage prohead protease